MIFKRKNRKEKAKEEITNLKVQTRRKEKIKKRECRCKMGNKNHNHCLYDIFLFIFHLRKYDSQLVFTIWYSFDITLHFYKYFI